jgi:streptomycin 6-kinase
MRVKSLRKGSVDGVLTWAGAGAAGMLAAGDWCCIVELAADVEEALPLVKGGDETGAFIVIISVVVEGHGTGRRVFDLAEGWWW